MQKNVLIIHTGGTFGMMLKETKTASEKPTEFLGNLLSRVPELKSIAHIDLEILCNIDSSDASPELWKNISLVILNNWHNYDGFVVIHGTDTMAWSACALAFFMENLTKPIVFTGSQRPLSALRNDARMNLVDSVELATYNIPEVMVCFDSEVHRATRVTKYSNEHLYAFKSYNAPLIGSFGVNFTFNIETQRPQSQTSKIQTPLLNSEVISNISSLVCIPGATLTHVFCDALVSSTQGIIIQGFGTGNLPIQNDSWIYLCKKALEKQIPVIMTSQCESGSVSLEMYENGRVYNALGVISALDMTFEATSIKLMIMLGRKVSFSQRHVFFAKPISFECTSSSKIKQDA